MRTQAWPDFLSQPYVLIALGIVLVFFAIYLVLFILDRRRAKYLELAPSSHFHELKSGVRVHYQSLGVGKPLILLHGLGASSFTWRIVIPLLAQRFRVIAIDLPGFGRSSKDPNRDYGLDNQAQTLIQFLEEIGIKKAVLVGSSMGGAIGLWMAKKAPEKFEKIIVMAPAVSSQLMPVELARLSNLFLPTTTLLMSKTLIRTILKRVLSKHELITDEIVRHYQRPYIEEPKSINTFIKATSILSDSRLPHELSDIESEILILYGAKDRLVPKAVMDQLRKVLPKAQYIEHKTAGHHPMEDEPEWVCEKLEEFINQ